MNGGAPQILGGPLWWYLVIVYVLAIGLSIYVSIDSRRAERAETLASLREPAWLYDVCQPAFLFLVVVVWLPFLPRGLSVLPVVLVPFALADQAAYLLRVVFPRPASTPGSDVDAKDDAYDELASDFPDGPESR